MTAHTLNVYYGKNIKVTGGASPQRAAVHNLKTKTMNTPTIEPANFIQNLPFPVMNPDAPQVFVGCLAAYNDGEIHGAWVEATDEEELNTNIRYILFTSPIPKAEEWMISDSMNFQGLSLGQFAPTKEIVAIAKALKEHGKPFAVYSKYHCGYDMTPEFLQQFKEDYKGVFDEREDFVYAELKRKGILGKAERIGLNEGYINYEVIGNDWFAEDYLDLPSGSYGQVYVFKRR